MKKIMMLLIAAVMLFGVSGQAMAYFANGDLIQVVYQAGGTAEVATDLGAFGATTAYNGATISFNTNPFPVAGTGAFSGATSDMLNVAYFIAGGAGPIWVSGPSAGQISGARQGAAAQTLTTLNGFYSSTGNANILSGAGTAQVTASQAGPQSYWTLEDKAAASTAGGWAGFIPLKNGETNLAGLLTTGYVDSYLYYYATPGAATAQPGVQVADIRTYADGHTEIIGTQVATPLPASIFLLGSGLMGLVGLKRKQAV